MWNYKKLVGELNMNSKSLTKMIILIIYMMIVSGELFGEDVTGYYYTDDGKTACMPTAKLREVLHSYNQYMSDVGKLKLELSIYKEISKKEIETCYSKCDKYISIMSKDDDGINLRNMLYFIGYSVVVFGGGFFTGYILSR